MLPVLVLLAQAAPATSDLKTAAEVLQRYVQALGGRDAIAGVQAMTKRGELVINDQIRIKLVTYAVPFKFLNRATLPDGRESLSGFDGTVIWSLSPQGPVIDKDTPREAVRRDADLQYPLHQPDYFQEIELAGVTDFEGRRCYWLHGTTRWGKDNNQYYDASTGLLAGYRYQSDASGSPDVTVELFEDYKNIDGWLIPMKQTTRTGKLRQTIVFDSVSFEDIPPSAFDLPDAVKAQLKNH